MTRSGDATGSVPCQLARVGTASPASGRHSEPNASGTRLATALAAHRVPHTVDVFAHGPHSLGLARGSGDTAGWTALAASWIAELVHGSPTRPTAGTTTP